MSAAKIEEQRATIVSAQAMTEAELQRGVLDCARLFRWRVAHFRPARSAHGWKTPVAADGAGFPDLVLVRERVLYRELKTGGGKLRREQAEWLTALEAAGCDVGVWRLSDWLSGAIEEALR